jgi:hypothetical protein
MHSRRQRSETGPSMVDETDTTRTDERAVGQPDRVRPVQVRRATRRPLPSSPFSVRVAQPVEQFSVGDRVTHDKHGLGSVVGVEEDTGVLVAFGTRREWITAPFAKLSKL